MGPVADIAGYSPARLSHTLRLIRRLRVNGLEVVAILQAAAVVDGVHCGNVSNVGGSKTYYDELEYMCTGYTRFHCACCSCNSK